MKLLAGFIFKNNLALEYGSNVYSGKHNDIQVTISRVMRTHQFDGEPLPILNGAICGIGCTLHVINTKSLQHLKYKLYKDNKLIQSEMIYDGFVDDLNIELFNLQIKYKLLIFEVKKTHR